MWMCLPQGAILWFSASVSSTPPVIPVSGAPGSYAPLVSTKCSFNWWHVYDFRE